MTWLANLYFIAIDYWELPTLRCEIGQSIVKSLRLDFFLRKWRTLRLDQRDDASYIIHYHFHCYNSVTFWTSRSISVLASKIHRLGILIINNDGAQIEKTNMENTGGKDSMKRIIVTNKGLLMRRNTESHSSEQYLIISRLQRTGSC